MTGWKSEVIHEIQALFRKAISNYIFRVFSAKFAKVF